MKIYLIPLQFKDNKLLGELSEGIKKVFSVEVIICYSEISLFGGFDSIRNQFNSSWLLKKLRKSFTKNENKVLGIINYDLFIPIFTFVFGEAELSGKVAVISTYRFQNKLYGLPEKKNVESERLLKESIHELGHTFGLRHCRNTGCVMYPSSYVEEIDYKPDYFCESCKSKIHNINKNINLRQ